MYCINWVEKDSDNLRTPIEEREPTKQKTLIVRLCKSHEERRSLKLNSVVVQSRSLKETLARVFEGYQRITESLKRLVFRTPFRPFYYSWSLLEETRRRQKLEVADAAKYTQLLYDVLDNELQPIRAEEYDVTSHRLIIYPYFGRSPVRNSCDSSARGPTRPLLPS